MNVMPINNNNQNRSFGAVRVPLDSKVIDVEKFQVLLNLMAKSKLKGKLEFGLTKEGEHVAYFMQHRYGTKAEDAFAKEISTFADGVSTVPAKTARSDQKRLVKSLIAEILKKLKDSKSNPQKI